MKFMQAHVEQILQHVEALRGGNQKRPFLIAIDGRCAAGKTTLAAGLADRLRAMEPRIAVIHADDFFLRPEQRTAQRLAQPGGNMDRERLCREVLLPLRRGDAILSYRAYDCQTQTMKPPVQLERPAVCILEGAYSCHPELRAYYDLRIFLTVTPEEQFRRIQVRNGDRAAVFQTRWIPLEEAYFSACDVLPACDLVLSTGL